MTATPTPTAPAASDRTVSAAVLRDWPEPLVIDVRRAAEYENQHIRGSYHVPSATLAEHRAKLARHLDDLDSPLVLVCQSGMRAEQGRRHLRGDRPGTGPDMPASARRAGDPRPRGPGPSNGRFGSSPAPSADPASLPVATSPPKPSYCGRDPRGPPPSPRSPTPARWDRCSAATCNRDVADPTHDRVVDAVRRREPAPCAEHIPAGLAARRAESGPVDPAGDRGGDDRGRGSSARVRSACASAPEPVPGRRAAPRIAAPMNAAAPRARTAAPGRSSDHAWPSAAPSTAPVLSVGVNESTGHTTAQAQRRDQRLDHQRREQGQRALAEEGLLGHVLTVAVQLGIARAHRAPRRHRTAQPAPTSAAPDGAIPNRPRGRRTTAISASSAQSSSGGRVAVDRDGGVGRPGQAGTPRPSAQRQAGQRRQHHRQPYEQHLRGRRRPAERHVVDQKPTPRRTPRASAAVPPSAGAQRASRLPHTQPSSPRPGLAAIRTRRARRRPLTVRPFPALRPSSSVPSPVQITSSTLRASRQQRRSRNQPTPPDPGEQRHHPAHRRGRRDGGLEVAETPAPGPKARSATVNSSSINTAPSGRHRLRSAAGPPRTAESGAHRRPR